jgi:hypothetical protein
MMADHASGVADRGEVVSAIPLVEERKISKQASVNGRLEIEAERRYTRRQRFARRQRVMP